MGKVRKMSKFLVDELPYYEGVCLLENKGLCYHSKEECPKYWSKDKVCSDDNPHECKWLKEVCE